MRLEPTLASKLAMALGGALCLVSSIALAEDTTSVPLLSTGTTILGQTITYPTTGAARIYARTTTFPPGAATAPHWHDVPLFTYVLDGELTIDYGPSGIKTYKKGMSYIEAIGTTHTGKNLGTTPVTILAVYVGAEGVENTTLAKHSDARDSSAK